ncbi:hypothetical protein J7I93_16115 [Bacillus sp. ISL-47]|uniref:hypothetical protein n=1 Tax=Bacillus sp. ISL-47 TaxID=2819130 RepID=UPI001BE574AE|nr:hypothetical protein [Bacillus sp. ISL-47]MBT2689713.1 hypothetical protein [Bacillus sp. ISL-47]MBT2709996.1 hypothetical protein [Pseudomonas sp. ISL-84]
MEDQLLLSYVFLISGIFIFFEAVYNGFKVQKHRGIISETWVPQLVLFLGGVAQPLIWFDLFELEPLVYITIILLIALIYLSLHLHIKGRVFVVHETSRAILLERIRQELDQYAITYSEEEKPDDKENTFILPDDGAVIKVSWRGEEKPVYTYRLSFRKWWRIYYYEEIKENIRESYKEEREGKVFWKQILTNAGSGAFILGMLIFMFFTMMP